MRKHSSRQTDDPNIAAFRGMQSLLEGDLADVFAFRATVAEALAALRAELNSEIAYCSDDDSDYDEGVQFAMTKLDETITALNLAHKEG